MAFIENGVYSLACEVSRKFHVYSWLCHIHLDCKHCLIFFKCSYLKYLYMKGILSLCRQSSQQFLLIMLEMMTPNWTPGSGASFPSMS